MFAMNFDITIGRYSLSMLDSATIKSSVESLADTAVVTIPATEYNKTLKVEEMIVQGNPVTIRLGYNTAQEELPVEFEGYVTEVSAADGTIAIHCENAIHLFRRGLKNAVLTKANVKEVMEHILGEIEGIDLACDFGPEFKFDKFAIYNTTGYDVLKKIQQDTGAAIYLRGKTLHVHSQYALEGRRVIYDFAVNIEKSSLKYKEAEQRKFQVTAEGRDAKGMTLKATKGAPGGETCTVRQSGITDMQTLEKRAEEVLKSKSYSGYEGSFTTWLEPQIAPGDIVELRDAEYEYKTGTYYTVAVETGFSSAGGSRKVTIGKKVE